MKKDLSVKDIEEPKLQNISRDFRSKRNSITKERHFNDESKQWNQFILKLQQGEDQSYQNSFLQNQNNGDKKF